MNNREAFEAWYKKEIDAGECFMRNKDNPEHYLSLNVHFAYKCWQAALASQAQHDHIGDNNKLVQSVNALAAQTGESPESITEWLTDKGGLTQLMLSHFGGMSSQAQQTELSSNPLQLVAQNPTAWLVRERSKRTGLLSNEILVENKNHFRESEYFQYEFVPLYTIPPAPEGGDK